LNRSVLGACWAFLVVAVATAPLACHPGADAPGVPLYPNAAATRLPRNQVALVEGPIEKVDGQEVGDQGGRFELLPGCHVIELDRRSPADNYSLSNTSYLTGQLSTVYYAMHMMAGGRYEIRRDVVVDGQTGRIVLSAREEAPGGAVTDLFPAKSADELRSCH
jgi:hypothetical protein